MNEIGSLYTFLLLYKTMIYTGRANSSGTMDRAVCFSDSNWNASSFEIVKLKYLQHRQ